MNRSFTWDVSLLRGGGWEEQVKAVGPRTPFQEQVSASTRATLPAQSAGRLGPWVATASPGGAGGPAVAPSRPPRLRGKAAAAPSPGALSARASRHPGGAGRPMPPAASSQRWRECSETRPACVPDASCIRSPSTKEAASDEGGKGRNVLQRHSPK